jgi:hypothetical protein
MSKRALLLKQRGKNKVYLNREKKITKSPIYMGRVLERLSP